MKTILILLASTIASLAGQITFAWDANPPEQNVTEYRLYRQTSPDTWELVGTSATTTLEVEQDLDVPSTWSVTAYNGLESERSVPLDVPARPGAPTNLRITIVIDIQTNN